MLKDFWEKKKHTIQLIAILTAIGALFLNISLPKDEIARNALLNIQFIWLFIITISIVILFVNFWWILVVFENRLCKKYSFDLEEIITTFLSLTFLWLLFYLWKYILALYKNSIKNFSGIIIYGLFMFIVPFHLLFLIKIKARIFKKNYYKSLLIILSSLFIIVFFSILIELLKFDFLFFRLARTALFISLIYPPLLFIFYKTRLFCYNKPKFSNSSKDEKLAK